jgi:hypothetical protein
MNFDALSILAHVAAAAANEQATDAAPEPAPRRQRLDAAGSHLPVHRASAEASSSARPRASAPIATAASADRTLRISDMLNPAPPAAHSRSTQRTAAIVDEIRTAVRGTGLDSKGFYRAIREANTLRAAANRWPDVHMQAAAGVSAGVARRVRETLRPATPRTLAVKAFLSETTPIVGTDTKRKRMSRAVEENDGRPADAKWPKPSMERAATLWAQRAPENEADRTAADAHRREIEAFIAAGAPPAGEDPPKDKFSRALQRNMAHPPDQRWRFDDVVQACGVDPHAAVAMGYRIERNARKETGETRPEVQAIRDRMNHEIAQAGGSMAKAAAYQLALEIKDTLPPGQQWKVRDIQEAIDIEAGHASRVAHRAADFSPTSRHIKALLDGDPAMADATPSTRYIQALNWNAQRSVDEAWPKRSISKAVGVHYTVAYDLR